MIYFYICSKDFYGSQGKVKLGEVKPIPSLQILEVCVKVGKLQTLICSEQSQVPDQILTAAMFHKRPVDEKPAAQVTVSVRCLCSHLLRDGRELAGSVTYISSVLRDTGLCDEMKLHISEYVCVRELLGTGGSSPVDTHSQ